MTREKAINFLKGYLDEEVYTEKCRNAHKMAIDALEQEPNTGHWKYDYTSADGHRTYHCSKCGCYLQPKHSEPLNSFKWCHLCGAKMVEPQESEG